MRLSELRPRFERIVKENGQTFYAQAGATIENADGICFLCPKCFVEKGGPVGTHSIICWRPRVGLDETPGPGRWEFQGASIDDLTLVAPSSSIKIDGACQAHFFIQNGEIKNA